MSQVRQILHADRSTVVRRVVRDKMAERGIVVIATSSIEEALSLVEANEIDLVLTGMELDDGRADTLLRKLRVSRRPQVPVAVLTGDDSVAVQEEILAMGAIDFVPKSAVRDDVLRNVIERVERSTATQQLIRDARIAVVDDSRVSRNAIVSVLSGTGATHVERFESGAAILAHPAEFDLYIVDIVLADTNGVELVQRFRTRPGATDATIVVVSQIERPETIGAALAAGADDYVTKPVNPQLFLARVWRAMAYRLMVRELREKNSELERISVTDELTGIANRRHVLNGLSGMLGEAASHPVGVAILDVDHFKRVNDVYGHQRGDEVLRAVARTLAAGVDTQTILGRFGGEEFLVARRNSDTRQMEALANSLRTSAARLAIDGLDRPITISGGVCSSEELGGHDGRLSVDKVIEPADQRLYRAKAAGRDRVVARDD